LSAGGYEISGYFAIAPADPDTFVASDPTNSAMRNAIGSMAGCNDDDVNEGMTLIQGRRLATLQKSMNKNSQNRRLTTATAWVAVSYTIEIYDALVEAGKMPNAEDMVARLNSYGASDLGGILATSLQNFGVNGENVAVLYLNTATIGRIGGTTTTRSHAQSDRRSKQGALLSVVLALIAALLASLSLER